MANANAAWSTTTKADAWFWCVANCEAGGVGAVARDKFVVPSTDPKLINKIGPWSRTVLIQCKTTTVVGYRAYHVTVQDRNWQGTWRITGDELSGSINDTRIPVC